MLVCVVVSEERKVSYVTGVDWFEICYGMAGVAVCDVRDCTVVGILMGGTMG